MAKFKVEDENNYSLKIIFLKQEEEHEQETDYWNNGCLYET
jgi:hypothetical protein